MIVGPFTLGASSETSECHPAGSRAGARPSINGSSHRESHTRHRRTLLGRYHGPELPSRAAPGGPAGRPALTARRTAPGPAALSPG
eukprot:13506-Hanusia_phi.AAC.1